MPASREAPFPKYLLKSDARAVIAVIEEAGFAVDLRVPAPGAVSITITAPDGQSRTQIGRGEVLAEALASLAGLCGIPIDQE